MNPLSPHSQEIKGCLLGDSCKSWVTRHKKWGTSHVEAPLQKTVALWSAEKVDVKWHLLAGVRQRGSA